ncbi:ArsB/NhaD family transporter [Sinomonas sp. JGH33]|uniref:ArsB/NhaD family transporter n=1 Tax=Sinomonas terricola TaxID=3110330 RepID=A0ABU5T1M9_9MICC|nr:SLC13 family permease [Sinomonas sp. JGH33]MEA5453572.1 ArsB/NhaD family transporter [Sinomonas sp. JGH33]
MPLAITGAVLLVLGLVAVLTGLLPWPALGILADRVVPILAFVAAITVVTELLNASGLFDWFASHFRRWGRGRAFALWVLVAALSLAATVFLSLDTTAVLLTPIVVILAKRCGLAPLPFALTAVWIANTGSLLLPVSNLTNLLALHALGDVSPGTFAARLALPALWCAAVPLTAVAVLFRRELAARYDLPGIRNVAAPAPRIPSSGPGATEPTVRAGGADRVLLALSGCVLVLLLPALVSGVPVWIPATAAAAVLTAAFGVRRRSALSWSLVPWQLIVFAAGLFVVMETLQGLGARALAAGLLGSGEGPFDLVRVSAAGALASNAINNLPAYLALEQAAGSPARLVALLVGVNAGPLVTPWASLATLIWHEQLRRLGVNISWWGYAVAGVVLVPLLIVPAALLAALA